MHYEGVWTFGCEKPGKIDRLGNHELLPQHLPMREKMAMVALGAKEEDGKKQNVCMDGTPEQLH